MLRLWKKSWQAVYDGTRIVAGYRWCVVHRFYDGGPERIGNWMELWDQDEAWWYIRRCTVPGCIPTIVVMYQDFLTEEAAVRDFQRRYPDRVLLGSRLETEARANRHELIVKWEEFAKGGGRPGISTQPTLVACRQA